MELFRDILTFQRFGCVKYLSDASYFATLVLRTTLSTGTKKKRERSCRGKTSRTEGVSDSQSFHLAQSALSTPPSFFSSTSDSSITHSSSLSIRLFIVVWPRPLSYTPPQSKRPIRFLISAHGVSRLKKQSFFGRMT